MRGRRSVSQQPSPSTCVPIALDAWESSSGIIPLFGQRLFDAKTGLFSLDSFGREVQACYQLGQTLAVRHQGADSSRVPTLSTSLLDFLGYLMSPSTRTWGTFCGAISMVIS